MKRITKLFFWIIVVILALAAAVYILITMNTQLAVGAIQKAFYGDKPFNSYEPLHTPFEGEKNNGQYLISEIRYDDEYPNGFLDITYPDGDTERSRPTLFYFHGGGFFSGSKSIGDPLAESEATALIDDICSRGYNIVNVDYALVPDCRFPVPLIQANRAIAYMIEHCDEYSIDMDNVVIMGSSAGAIIASQMGGVISNPEYAAELGISSAMGVDQISAVVIDDAPLDYDSFSLAAKILIGNYVKGNIYLTDSEKRIYNSIEWITEEYPEAFLLGSEYRHDMNLMYEKLREYGCEAALADPYREYGEEKPHCFVANERSDSIAHEAFSRMMDFMDSRTRQEK